MGVRLIKYSFKYDANASLNNSTNCFSCAYGAPTQMDTANNWFTSISTMMEINTFVAASSTSALATPEITKTTRPLEGGWQLLSTWVGHDYKTYDRYTPTATPWAMHYHAGYEDVIANGLVKAIKVMVYSVAGTSETFIHKFQEEMTTSTINTYTVSEIVTATIPAYHTLVFDFYGGAHENMPD